MVGFHARTEAGPCVDIGSFRCSLIAFPLVLVAFRTILLRFLPPAVCRGRWMVVDFVLLHFGAAVRIIVRTYDTRSYTAPSCEQRYA